MRTCTLAVGLVPAGPLSTGRTSGLAKLTFSRRRQRHGQATGFQPVVVDTPATPTPRRTVTMERRGRRRFETPWGSLMGALPSDTGRSERPYAPPGRVARLAGVWAPPPTPFVGGVADGARLVDLAGRLLAAGCDGLCPFGTTGEGTALGVDERMRLLEALVGGGVPAERLVPGVGLPALPDVVRIARAAVGLGCAGVLLLPPYYHRDATDAGLARFVDELVDGVADARLRVVLYHIPGTAGIGWSLELVEALAARHAGVVVGIKDSSGDWGRLEALVRMEPRLAVFAGSERHLSELLAVGGAGTISAMANVVPGRLQAVVDEGSGTEGPGGSQVRADAARRLVAELGFPMVPALKALVAHRLGDPAWAEVRAPLVQLGGADVDRLVETWRAAGLEAVDSFGP